MKTKGPLFYVSTLFNRRKCFVNNLNHTVVGINVFSNDIGCFVKNKGRSTWRL